MPQSSDQIRSAFLDFFGGNDHEVVPSGPVVLPHDPTLMFANAGMVQFKDVFTGKEKRPYSRATSSQKCIRISGKHNDLENVGPSPRHHTFFEMLGNFSFGDYFKEAAIVYAWDFIKQLGLSEDRLVVTYFGGEDGIPADEEARDLWKKISGLSDERIIACGAKENFWSMGDTGPCGPCSEIHLYQGPWDGNVSSFGEEQTPEGHGWMEIWNLVFMQFERDQSGKLDPLPAPCVDTGMGLERIVSVMQDKTSNYETDGLRVLVDEAARIAGKPYNSSMDPDDVSMRVIADHSRLTAFLLAEGVMPDKSGAEYVLRRVMRRAIRHGHRLGIEKPFLHEVALKVVETMGHHYPELEERKEHIAKVAEQEEVRFRETIERGLHLLEEQFEQMKQSDVQVLDGRAAYKLYNTYGFPLDLTQVICDEQGYSVDKEGYDEALAEDKELSGKGPVGTAIDAVYHQALERVPGKNVAFSGYSKNRDTSEIVAILVDGQLVDHVSCELDGETPIAVEKVEVIVARTPFYGESGGQQGDRGTIRSEDGQLSVEDCQKPVPGLITHRGTLTQGTLEVGKAADLFIDIPRREAIRRNHSATHLLHWALRQVLGSHAQQKGSLVAPDRLRFDFTHGEAISKEQLAKIEDLVNERVLSNAPVQTELLSIDAAKERGAMMLFGEKYDANVRMLTITDSVELCGGTHARATGDIGILKVIGEQSIAAGVRRITAATGAAAVDYMRQLESTLDQAGQIVKAGNVDLPTKLEKLMAHEKALEKKVTELQRKLASGGDSGGVDSMLSQAKEISGGVKVLSLRTDVSDRATLRELAEKLRDKLGNSIVMVASESEGKAQMVLTVARALTDKYQAGKLIRPLAGIVGGSGGGRPDMAQAGGTDVSKLDQAVAALYKSLESEQLSLM